MKPLCSTCIIENAVSYDSAHVTMARVKNADAFKNIFYREYECENNSDGSHRNKFVCRVCKLCYLHNGETIQHMYGVCYPAKGNRPVHIRLKRFLCIKRTGTIRVSVVYLFNKFPQMVFLKLDRQFSSQIYLQDHIDDIYSDSRVDITSSIINCNVRCRFCGQYYDTFPSRETVLCHIKSSHANMKSRRKREFRKRYPEVNLKIM